MVLLGEGLLDKEMRPQPTVTRDAGSMPVVYRKRLHKAVRSHCEWAAKGCRCCVSDAVRHSLLRIERDLPKLEHSAVQ